MNPSESPVAEPTPGDGAEAGASQSVKAQLRLREMILAGELPGGARIAELAIVEKLGVSRTPIRAALMRLEQEGLLQRLPGGGYAVPHPGQLASFWPAIRSGTGRIRFAGEHTETLAGYMESAVRSGHRIATQLGSPPN